MNSIYENRATWGEFENFCLGPESLISLELGRKVGE